jgi:hypothetical protein
MAQKPPSVMPEQVAPTQRDVVFEVANALLAYVVERPGLEQAVHEKWVAFEEASEQARMARTKLALETVQSVCDVDNKKLTADGRTDWVFRQVAPEREIAFRAEAEYRLSQAHLRINDETQKSYRAILRAIGDER